MNPTNANPIPPLHVFTYDELWGLLNMIRRITTTTPQQRAFKNLLWNTCVDYLLNRLPHRNDQNNNDNTELEEPRCPNRNTYVP